MSERNYYVICDDNCRFEGMTKEQIYDAIAEATGSTPTPVDSAFITKIKEQNANHNLKMWKGTEAQYNALAEKDTDTLYIITRANVAPRIVNSTVLEEEINTTATNLAELQEYVDALQEEIDALQGEVQPINRGGTGATSKEAALRNLDLYGAETRTIVWRNVDTTLDFAARKLNNDFSTYDAVEVLFNFSTSTGQTISRIKIKKPLSGEGYNSAMAIGIYGAKLGYRTFNISSAGVLSFGDAFVYNQYGSLDSKATQNSMLIPDIVYGIKFAG